ncbi:hypothetical protein ABH935_005703 [Catenulispora sp. GAS73]|uniref:VC0807 family protein n=1 Tax=Catenulispora sp. GAS73 TaxID=3156269 RepID=UPI0035181B23
MAALFPGRVGGLLRQPAVLLNLIAPVVAYRVLAGRGMSATGALAVAAVFPAAGALRGFVRDRRVDPVALLALTAIAVGLVAGLVFHAGRILLVKESITSGVLGLVCLGSLFVGRPLIFGLRRRLYMGADPVAEAEFERSWQEPRMRTEARRTTAVWGVALLAEAAVRVGLSYVLSTSTMVTVSPLIAVVILGPLGVATLRPRMSGASAEPARVVAGATE